MFLIDFEHFKKAASDTTVPQIVDVEKSLPELVAEEEEQEVYDKLRVFSTLTQFQIKLFMGEPKLVRLFSFISRGKPLV